MSTCTSYTLSGLNAKCKNSIGGIQEVYIGYYKDLLEIIVNNNILTPVMHRGLQRKLYKFELRKNTASMSTTLQNSDNAASYFQTELSMSFLKQDTVKRLEMMALTYTDIFAIVKDRNGKYWFLGKDEPLSISAGGGTTGQARSDANAYTITLTDNSNELPFQVDEESLNDLLTDWVSKCLAMEVLTNGTVLSITDSVGGSIGFGINYTVITKKKYEEMSIDEIIQLDWRGIGIGGGNEHTDEMSAGDVVLIKSEEPITINPNEYDVHAFLYTNYPVYLYGNIASLFDINYIKDNVRTYTSDVYTIYGLFWNEHEDGNIMSHPTKELVIPFENIDYSLDTFGKLFVGNTLMEYGPSIYTENIEGSDGVFNYMFESCENLKYVQANFLTDSGNTQEWLNDIQRSGTFRTSVAGNANNRTTSGVPANWKLIVD